MELNLSETAQSKITAVQDLIKKAGARPATIEEIIEDILFETGAEELIPFRVKVEAARHDPAKRKKVHKIFMQTASKATKKQKVKGSDGQSAATSG